MALPENRKAVQAILDELEPRILGQQREGFSCCCGAIHCGDATAVEIDPAGDEYPGQEVMWYLWSVRMKEHEGGSGWSCGLSEFVDSKELEAIFKKHFGNIRREKNPYQLDVSGAERVHQSLPPAVRIKENDIQYRFSFDWGNAQVAAEDLEKIYKGGPRRIAAGTEKYLAIGRLLETLEPVVYRGGPDPELSHESKWHLSYREPLIHAIVESDHIFFQNMSSQHDWRGNVLGSIDVVFMKHPA